MGHSPLAGRKGSLPCPLEASVEAHEPGARNYTALQRVTHVTSKRRKSMLAFRLFGVQGARYHSLRT
jgi:hypothetical protein